MQAFKKHLSWIRPLWLQLCPCGGYKVESSWSSFSRCCNASHHNCVSARNFSPAANYSIILLARWEWSSNRSAVPLPRSLITRVKQKARLFCGTMKKVLFYFASRLSTRKSNRVKILGRKKNSFVSKRWPGKIRSRRTLVDDFLSARYFVYETFSPHDIRMMRQFVNLAK